MAEDGDARSELEARVYSRAGADEPRSERVDPLTGHIILVTESEWRLLLADRERAERERAEREHDRDRDGAAGREPDAAAARHAESSASPAGRLRERRRILSAMGAGAVIGALLVGASLWAGSLDGAPTVEVAIAPVPDRRIAAIAGVPPEAAFDIFRDPEMRNRALPPWLQDVFPLAHVAELIGPGEELPGAMAYAVVPRDTTACIIVPLEPNGGVWNCTSTERVVRRGMTMHAPIPADLGSDPDLDGDGVTGDPSRSDLLTVEWHADGTFLITRE